MAIASSTVAAITAAVAFAGAAASTYGTIQAGQAQQQQAAHQAALAQRNAQIAGQHAELAEEEGRETRREAYDAAQQKRREAARMVGQERAMSAFSGVQVDQGSALDLTQDIAERGAIDAFNLERAGDRAEYRQRLRGWENRTQAEGQRIQADALSMRQTGDSQTLGLALRQGQNFMNMLKQGKPSVGVS